MLERLFEEFTPSLRAATRCTQLTTELLERSRELLEQELARDRGPLQREFPTLHLLLERRWTEALERAIYADLRAMDADGSRPEQVEREVRAELELLSPETSKIRVFGRVDRVDRLRDGSLRVIDFKTGAHPERDVVNLQVLRGQRPQLATYGLLLSEQPGDQRVSELCIRSVSYTHLTLPTILLV